mgnify:CR=1 FL=1
MLLYLQVISVCQGRPLCWHDIMLWLVVFTQYWVVLCGVMHQTLKVTAYHSLHLLYKWFYRHYYYYSALLSFIPSIRLTHHVRVYIDILLQLLTCSGFLLIKSGWTDHGFGMQMSPPCQDHDLCCCCKWFTPGADPGFRRSNGDGAWKLTFIILNNVE